MKERRIPHQPSGFIKVITMDTVTEYINQILKPALKEFSASNEYIDYTTEIVYTQILSLLRHWEDRTFRSAVLLIGREEGAFYEPASKLDVRSFVVVTIRNSPIETLQSDDYKRAGLTTKLADKDVRRITSEAIKYFGKCDFNKLCMEARQSVVCDIYGEVFAACPTSFVALSKLAMISSKTLDYPKVLSKKPYGLEELNKCPGTDNEDKMGVVLDGYSGEIDSLLAKYLKQCEDGVLDVFLSDSFKALTRNFEKLISIIEFLLTRDCAFVSSNYYIENGHVEQRIKLLRPAHYARDMFMGASHVAELGYKHKTALKLLKR